MNQKMSSAFDRLAKFQDMPRPLQHLMVALKGKVDVASSAIEDLKHGNTAIFFHTKVIRDRQNAWVSNLPAPNHSEICHSALAMPEGSSKEPLNIIGVHGDQIVKDFVSQR